MIMVDDEVIAVKRKFGRLVRDLRKLLSKVRKRRGWGMREKERKVLREY